MGDQPVADGEARVRVRGGGKRQIHLGNADDHSADDVDEGDQKAGNGVAADELGGTVHRAVEAALFLQLLAPCPGLILVDQARREVGVDRHLFSGHRVEGEPGGNLGDAPGTLGNDHEVDDHQDGEDDDPDDEVVPHDEAAERFDHPSGGPGAFVTVAEDQPGRRQIERQTDHRRK